MTTTQGNTDKARIIYPDGRVEEYADQNLAYRLWLGLPKAIRAAFRGKHDARPVQSWDYINSK